jgi:small-conductance mechanosensitive channel
MGTDSTISGTKGGAYTAPGPVPAQRGLAPLWLVVSSALWVVTGAAQPAEDTAQPSAVTAQPTADPAVLEEAAKALTTRLEALEKLASGALPEIPLDSLLGVALDDDSSMIERDAEARFERRRLTIALNQAERQQNKSPAELQLLRDQISALELERKVLALPLEVRERLVAEQFKQPAVVTPVASAPAPSEDQKPDVAAEAPPATTEPSSQTETAAAAREVEGARPWLSGWLLFGLLLIATFVVARVVGAVARAGSQMGAPDERRAQFAALAQVGIVIAGVVAALMLSFRLPPELFTVVVGALALGAVLAGKDVAKSLLGGLVLFLEHPFRVGHRVEIGGVEGRVAEMGVLSVRLIGPQQKAITVPNSEFLTKLVSASPPSGILTPLQVDFYVRPQDDIAHAKQIINEVIQSTRGADASKTRSGILVTQVPVNGVVMVRLRAKIFVTGTHPEQEIASELSERVLARLQGRASPDSYGKHDSDAPEEDAPASSPRSGAALAAR